MRIMSHHNSTTKVEGEIFLTESMETIVIALVSGSGDGFLALAYSRKIPEEVDVLRFSSVCVAHFCLTPPLNIFIGT